MHWPNSHPNQALHKEENPKKALFNFVTLFVLMLCFNFFIIGTHTLSCTITSNLIGSAFAAIVIVWYNLVSKLSD
ncbi:MAG: hypothetical protein MJZ63_02925 [Muribaculaceae bacterium]|nr:hypothetical protein [Muribaculaceae bacterium]